MPSLKRIPPFTNPLFNSWTLLWIFSHNANFSIRYYETGWFDQLSEDTTAFSAIFYLSASLIYVLIAKNQWKHKWFKYMLTAILMYTVNVILKKAGILHSLVWWDTWYYVLLSVFLLKLTVTFSKHLSIGPTKNA